MELTVFDEQLYRVLDPSSPLQKLADGFQFTEGPVRRGEEIWFTDFPCDRIYRYAAGRVALVTDDAHRTIGMTGTKDGRILGCASNLHAICDVESGEILADSFHGFRFHGTNDVVEDSRGGLWFTDPYVREHEGRGLPFSAVFHLDAGELSPVCFDLPWPNGLALSPDERTLYLIDSRQLRLYAMDLATLARRLLVQFTKGMGPGLPDGMCVRGRRHFCRGSRRDIRDCARGKTARAGSYAGNRGKPLPGCNRAFHHGIYRHLSFGFTGNPCL